MDRHAIAALIAADPRAMDQLRVVRDLALPDWCIAAGFVRTRVWDWLHGRWPARAPADIDVLFFDRAREGRDGEAHCEAHLRARMPGPVWQVRNQARMHVAKGVAPHRDTAHAMTFWLETATAVGIRLEADDSLSIVAPLGIDDLVGLVCRPTAWGAANRAAYEARIADKGWRAIWPRLRFLDAQAARPCPGTTAVDGGAAAL